MTLLQHFFIEEKYYGKVERKNIFVHADKQQPYSYAYFCPCCGEQWAKFPIEGGMEGWQVHTLPCRKHRRSALDIPGSVILTWEPYFNEILPESVWRWEMERHLDHLERKV